MRTKFLSVRGNANLRINFSLPNHKKINKHKGGPAQATKDKMALQDISGRYSNFLTSECSSKRRSKFVDRETQAVVTLTRREYGQ